ncbi:MAG: hypothetical protein AAF541_05820 [Pseudomonadota bacterium]
MTGCGAELANTAEPDQLSLPETLVEVSGLARTDDSRLLAISDEIGVVYALDMERREVKRFTQFGQPPVRGDFEGIAYSDGVVYATTSKGELYIRRVDAVAGEFSQVKTGFGRRCEIEGLAMSPENKSLWFLCKTARKKKYRGKVTAFRWNVELQEEIKPPWQVDLEEVGINGKLSPSGISFSATDTSIYVIAAKQHVWLQFHPGGELTQLHALSPRYHPQAEGILVADGFLYTADEGVNGSSRLTRYPLHSFGLKDDE